MLVKLDGILGCMFGNEYTLSVQTPIEALHALSCMVDGFKDFLQSNDICVWVNGKSTTDISELSCKYVRETELIVAMPVMGAGGAIAGGGIFSVLSGVFTMVGLGIGTYALIEKLLTPKMPTISQDEDGNRASYGFGGAVTTITQGNVIPVAYGECLQGGFVLTWQVTSDITRY